VVDAGGAIADLLKRNFQIAPSPTIFFMKGVLLEGLDPADGAASYQARTFLSVIDLLARPGGSTTK
jgi:hypothetical protein